MHFVFRSRDTDFYGGSNSKVIDNEEFFDAWDRSMPVADKKFTSTKPSVPIVSAPASDEAVKKFGNAKSISSDQYFGNGQEMDYETRASLARFEGQKSRFLNYYLTNLNVSGLGSADLWGNGSAQQQTSSYSDHIPEMADIKDSIRSGAGKVAERVSSLFKGMNQS
jgi:ADP-ribosylation factor GTPase-activating protein 2/3